MHSFQTARNLTGAARAECGRCLRPATHCLCQWIPSLDNRTRVVVLQHPVEARHALNTARLAVLGLRNASLHVGAHFDPALWQVAGYDACLLFPGDGAEALAPQTAAPSAAAARPRLLVVPDGTWRQARQLIARHPDLAALPRVTLTAGQSSRYRVRHAGLPDALSTIEAVAAALDVLDVPRSYAELLKPFEKLVAGQIAAMGSERYVQHHVQRSGSRTRHQGGKGQCKSKPPEA